MVEATKEFRVDVTSADVQSVMNENPVVALQVQVKALMRHIKELTEENVRLASELEDAKKGMDLLPDKETAY
jgi:regulator of replication initiation timing